jgi:hypothetical protein
MFRLILLGVSLVLFAEIALARSPDQLQIGEQWSRVFFNGQLTGDESLNNLIKATARIDLRTQSGTAFYVGKFLGKHIMVTNNHVLSDSEECVTDGKIYFQYTNHKYRCGRIIARFKDLELTFFSIHVAPKDEYLFENLALKFDFAKEHLPGERVITAGYGYHLNPGYRLTYENSPTCLIATPTVTPRFIQVRNDEGVFNSWSFVNACEISPGDSGSALVDPNSGRVVGVNWATSSAKPMVLQNSYTVYDWIKTQNQMLWPSLSQGIPNSRILQKIRENRHPVLMEFLRANL